jgi:phosphoglucan,water dikinase
MARSMVQECGPMARWGLRGSGFEGLRKLGHVRFAGIDGRVKRTVATNSVVRCEKKVKVRLRIDHQVQFGESHAILGSAQCTGAWQERVPMHWTESGWVVELEANSEEKLEYKHIIINHCGDVVWEGGPNRTLSLPSEGEFEVVTHWDCTYEELQLQGEQVVNGSPLVRDDVGGKQAQALEPGSTQREPEIPVHRLEELSTSFAQQWQGGARGDGKETAGKWDATGLDGPALQIVEGDKSASNWWRKLEVARTLLTGELGTKERLKTLVNVAVYLKWINTGQIACTEDGQHYRPNKHAEISRRIFVELERISGERGGSLRELLVVRKIHPCLPAFKPEFTASVPLTRIRDIAHRNDIPQDLKQEIKHTLQNKLHRSAGPEDLVAAEGLLTRVTETPGEYSEAFVKEFKTFYSELKDFFNAGSLTEQLEGLRPSIDKDTQAILEHFLWSKDRLETLDKAGGANIIEPLLDTIYALTNLRRVLAKGLESGLRNDASDESIAMRQKWRLSELGLEDYSFVLLSRIINAFDGKGGASWFAEEVKTGKVGQWTPALTCLAMGVQQLGLSGLHLEECIAIKNELLAWPATAVVEAKDTKAWALRVKATVNRARRLAETYTDMVLKIYPNYVEKLGKAFGIPENTVRTYAEADIRASVVFQVAKLCSLLLKAIRATVGGDGFDTIMPGRSAGLLVEVDRIVPGSLPSSASGPVILLVRRADGDEEVKAAGSNVAGVVLQHELPHLSHLGVRARQEKIAFVTCDDEEKIAALRPLLNRPVEFVASSEFVHIRPYESPPVREAEEDLGAGLSSKSQLQAKLVNDDQGPSFIRLATLSKVTEPKHISVVRSPPGTVLDLSEATTPNSGTKAAVCGVLAVLSEQAQKVQSDQGVPAKFSVPKGKVIPFGAMEDVLESSASLDKFNAIIARVETALLEGGELDNVCSELRSLVAELPVSEAILDELASGGLSKTARLIVRSSANVEDLEGMSAAGLYESIPNVKLSEPESFGKAVAQVWASLYTRRAVLSRRVAGVPQKEASMAVLVQELLSPELSFVLHTVSPIDHDKAVLQAELAVGLGETLASGTRGTPWRLSCNKFDGTVMTLSFANFSEQIAVKNGSKDAADGSVVRQVVDYSSQPLSSDPVFREQVGQRLATVGFFLEQHFKAPQDIEGCIIGQDVYIVQSRPQP